MTTERSLFTLFKICAPIAVLPFLCLLLIPLSWNYLIYAICIICIGCLTYWWEHTKTIVELGITGCFVLSVLCFLTACWGIGSVLASEGTSSAETWQIISALAAAGLTGTAAFATLGTLLHVLDERKRHNQMLTFELYDKHQQHFESRLERIADRINSNEAMHVRKFRFANPKTLYDDIFINNSVHNMNISVCNNVDAKSRIFELSLWLEEVVSASVEFVNSSYEVGDGFKGEEQKISKISKVLPSLYCLLGVEPVDGHTKIGDVVEGSGENEKLTMVNVFFLMDAVRALSVIVNEIRKFCNLPAIAFIEDISEMASPVLLYAVLRDYHETSMWSLDVWKAHQLRFEDGSIDGIIRRAEIYQYWEKVVSTTLADSGIDFYAELKSYLYISTEDNSEACCAIVNSSDRLELLQHNLQTLIHGDPVAGEDALTNAFVFLAGKIKEAKEAA